MFVGGLIGTAITGNPGFLTLSSMSGHVLLLTEKGEVILKNGDTLVDQDKGAGA
jgi:hypothetical protein